MRSKSKSQLKLWLAANYLFDNLERISRHILNKLADLQIQLFGCIDKFLDRFVNCTQRQHCNFSQILVIWRVGQIFLNHHLKGINYLLDSVMVSVLLYHLKHEVTLQCLLRLDNNLAHELNIVSEPPDFSFLLFVVFAEGCDVSLVLLNYRDRREQGVGRWTWKVPEGLRRRVNMVAPLLGKLGCLFGGPETEGALFLLQKCRLFRAL